MESISVGEIEHIVGGRIICGDENAVVSSVCIDSRKAVKGSLFVALPGKKVNGKDYIESAFEKGAVCAITEEEFESEKGTVILVRKSLDALQGLASNYRRKFTIPVVAVTGSVGKSSTKDFCHLVLSEMYKTEKNEGNLNSDIGMPLSVFNLSSESEAAVFEMGMSNLGEIESMSKIAKPFISIITNIGVAHISNLGSRKNILKAKLEIEAGMPVDGAVILNGDDEMLMSARGRIIHESYTCGIDNKDCDFIADDIKLFENKSTFKAVSRFGECNIEVPVPGIHMVRNALCAYAAGILLCVPPEKIASGILKFENPKMHFSATERSGITYINDCYNAGPESMKAALSMLRDNYKGRKIAVLASMLDLGELSESLHKELGKEVAEKADVLMCYGEETKATADAAKESGIKEVHHFKDLSFCAAALAEMAEKGDVILFKGSRSMKTEICLKEFLSLKGWDKE